jgi:23S rRNA pseudouridine2605 synthase
MRLNKFLALGLGVSRREADDLISAGKVLVNNEKAILGARVEDGDKVLANGKEVKASEFVYIALNKPAGYVSSRKRQDDVPTLYELLPEKYQSLKTVGRLDKDSQGLILLTNDGDFTFQMTHPKFYKEKFYEVGLDRPLEPLHQQMISDFGIDLTDGKSNLGHIFPLDNKRMLWHVTLSEGRNRQIRRTFGALGYTVVYLYRTQFGKYVLDGLEEGKFIEVQKIEG